LGILEDFLKRPHQEVRELGGQIGPDFVALADFFASADALQIHRVHAPVDFLDFINEHGTRYPAFKVKTRAEGSICWVTDGRVVGVKATTPQGPIEIRADLVVARTVVIRLCANVPAGKSRTSARRWMTLVQALAAAGRLRSDIRPDRHGKINGKCSIAKTTTNAGFLIAKGGIEQ